MRIELSKEEWVLIARAADQGLDDSGDGRYFSTREMAANGDSEATQQVGAVAKLNKRLGFVA